MGQWRKPSQTFVGSFWFQPRCQRRICIFGEKLHKKLKYLSLIHLPLVGKVVIINSLLASTLWFFISIYGGNKKKKRIAKPSYKIVHKQDENIALEWKSIGRIVALKMNGKHVRHNFSASLILDMGHSPLPPSRFSKGGITFCFLIQPLVLDFLPANSYYS